MSGYMHSDPFDEGMLAVGTIHHIHYEQYGKPDGKPVIFLHGGPGGQTSKANTAYFNPALYRVILLDQRGSGKSTPQTELRENTTQHLVSDIEALRTHLAIPKWHLLFGGSWGSTLALLYAQAYPDRVGSMLLRGIFTTRDAETSWSRSALGAANVFPEAWEAFVGFLPVEERGDPSAAYYRRLTGADERVRVAAAREWNRWDLSIGALRVDEGAFAALEDVEWSLKHALMEAHYSVHGFWLEEGQILERGNLEKIAHIPVTIVQGRYDMVCPAQTAWELHRGLPQSKLIWVADAGHTPKEPGIKAELLKACDEFSMDLA
ncbi:hypothetical protein N7466_004441 [Penicillium verhagenii]|uniref:uncharacterized protein n=1 Tax=Penicillium verhagenii TaxID=1562060 RepID=UPI00254560F4|nr:uncharacterized protein N7466_004441 [Penicillium verhagenii]KAJ5934894.1 hypothetical protein N7466_004441 [Penicillium verhagenii]